MQVHDGSNTTDLQIRPHVTQEQLDQWDAWLMKRTHAMPNSMKVSTTPNTMTLSPLHQTRWRHHLCTINCWTTRTYSYVVEEVNNVRTRLMSQLLQEHQGVDTVLVSLTLKSLCRWRANHSKKQHSKADKLRMVARSLQHRGAAILITEPKLSPTPPGTILISVAHSSGRVHNSPAHIPGTKNAMSFQIRSVA